MECRPETSHGMLIIEKPALLPPLSHVVSGQGSGSASMAHRFNEALRKECPYCIIDEDRAAQNLVVPCYMSEARYPFTCCSDKGGPLFYG